MEFKDLCKKRRSVHSFVPNQKIKKEELENIISLAQFTPSGYNAQPWEFAFVQEDERLKELQALAFDQKHITEAGNVLIVLGDINFAENNKERILDEWRSFRGLSEEKLIALRASLEKTRTEDKWREMTLRNSALVCMSLLFSLEDAGWAACPMMGFSQRKIRPFLNLPENIMPIMMITFGKEDITKADVRLPRKSVDEVLHYEQYEDS